jgi:hypothetical protein
MFFVSLLLTQTLSWMRKQSGTTSLRAILYMDEIFGYFPPVANPPSKQPLLTLLKQARAFGLGVVLATQNPVDLDYKGLANTGTWFIGRLQTERDKARVLEGLEGATASSGTKFNRQKMEEILAGLGNRVFLMNNVHEDAPVIFHTRWTLSYLRGPLTRNQIKTLMELRKPAIASALVAPAADRKSSSATSGSQRSILPPDVPQYFIPLRGSQPAATHLLYRPMLLGSAQVRVADAKAGIDVTEECTFLTPMMDSPVPIDWDDARKADIAVSDLEKNPQGQAEYMGLPEASSRGKNYELWSKDFAGWLYRTHKVELLKSRSLKEISKPGESERDFRLRLQQSGREQRDKQLNSLRQKYAPKIAVLQDRIRRAEQMKEKQRTEARSSQVQAAISVGASILGAFLGRKTISATNIGRATTAIRSAGRVMKESQEVGQAEENVADLQRKLAELEAQFKSESEALAAATDPLNEKLETISINPIKANIVVKLVALAWTPNWRNTKGTSTPALM